MSTSNKNESKTVVCGYCFTKGHNRQTCPQLASDMKSEEQKHGPNHPLIVEYKKNRKSISKSASERARMPRSCTYCHTLGHNRRTCNTLKSDMKLAVERNTSWRKEYYTNVKRLGIGIGAMLKVKDHRKSTDGLLWMVLRHEWESINYINEGERAVLCQQISNVGRRMWLTIPPTLVNPSLTFTGWEVVSPSYDFALPSKWFSGELGIDTLFRDFDKESRII